MIDYRALVANYNFHPNVKKELAHLLEKHNHRPSKERRGSSVCSFLTMERRSWNLCAIFQDLHQLGYPIERLGSFRQRHVAALVEHWHKGAEVYGTVENKLSYLRALLHWQNRPNFVLPLETFWPDSDRCKRRSATDRDKSWSGAAIDISQVLADVAATDQVVAVQLELQWVFGLRKSEAFLFRPIMALDEALTRVAIAIGFGTKGGRPRTVSLVDVSQIDVLVRAAALAKSEHGSTIPARYCLKQWNHRYYNVVRSHGIVRDLTRGLGVTSHGLRHEYLQSRYQALTGEPAPVKGGGTPDPQLLIAAMARVVEDAGHSALHKASAYLGKLPSLGRLQKLLDVQAEPPAGLLTNPQVLAHDSGEPGELLPSVVTSV